jgi:RsiW-degrading membrane proteinase PrsW (M82 family)
MTLNADPTTTGRPAPSLVWSVVWGVVVGLMLAAALYVFVAVTYSSSDARLAGILGPIFLAPAGVIGGVVLYVTRLVRWRMHARRTPDASAAS